ncbi:MAG: hypothetical protein QXL01_01355, partial [Thermoplasmatales archaeon]
PPPPSPVGKSGGMKKTQRKVPGLVSVVPDSQKMKKSNEVPPRKTSNEGDSKSAVCQQIEQNIHNLKMRPPMGIRSIDDAHDKKLKRLQEKVSKANPPEGVNPEKYESCVQQVKAKHGTEGKVNPWAVCSASLKKAISQKMRNIHEGIKRKLMLNRPNGAK